MLASLKIPPTQIVMIGKGKIRLIHTEINESFKKMRMKRKLDK